MDIVRLLDDIINNRVEMEDALSTLSCTDEFEEACEIASKKISPAYDHGQTDLGDSWAKLLMNIKHHAIDHLSERDKMKFIAEAL